MVWKPHVTVAAVLERDGRFLLVEERVKGRKVINQPAGHLEDGESLAEAVIRETREETRWRMEPTELIGVYRRRNPENGDTFMRVCFTGRLLEEDVSGDLDDGILRTLWLGREEIAAENGRLRSPMVLRCVDDYRNGQRFPLSLITDL